MRLIATAALLAGLVVGSSACVDEPCGAEIGDLCLLAGTGELGFNRDGLAPADTDLFLPSAARRGPDGRVYLMDFNNQRLRWIDEGRVETLIGSGFHAFADTSADLLATPLENPIDFGFLSDGRLVFVSYHDPRVLTIGADGTLDSLAGASDGLVATVGDEGDGGPASEALFLQLDGVAIGPDDSIYVSDSLANRVRRISPIGSDPAAATIDTVIGTGAAEYTGDGGPGSEAALHWPTALSFDAAGNLYIADTFNHAIRRLDPDGILTTVAGTGVEGFSGDQGPATQAQLSQPFGVAVDEDGSIYVADRGNFRVRRIDPDGTIDSIAGVGLEGQGAEGRATASRLGYLARIAVDEDQLMIVDQSNARVWRLRLR